MTDLNRPIRVVLADDHELVLEGLRGLLERENDMTVVATATDGESLLALIESERPDVVVMDLAMPTRDGLSCLREIRRRGVPGKVVILTAVGGSGRARRGRTPARNRSISSRWTLLAKSSWRFFS